MSSPKAKQVAFCVLQRLIRMRHCPAHIVGSMVCGYTDDPKVRAKSYSNVRRVLKKLGWWNE